MRYGHIVQRMMAAPWAVLPATAAALVQVLALRAAGEALSEAEIQARIGAVAAERAAAAAAAQGQVASAGGGVAVLPLFGLLNQRVGPLEEVSGATSTERVAAAFRAALADPQVEAIVLQVDSPGGTVYGIDELAAEIYRARGSKPVVAVVDSLAASAAYWVASAAEELVVTPGGEVGSIGVYSMHEDISRALEAKGIGVSLITAGTYKVEDHPFAPLSDEARAAIQARVDDYYGMFTGAVARHRGVSSAAVRGGFGEGRVVGARQAVELGMADRVATMREVLGELTSGRRRRAGRAADGAPTERRALDDLDRRRRQLRLHGAG